MRFRALIVGLITAGLLGTQTARAQYQRRVRHYDHQGRPYYRGPLQLTLAGGTALYNGDLGNRLSDDFLSPALSLGVLYRLTPHLHLGSELSYFKMGARDYLPERSTAVSGLAFTSTNGLGTVFFRLDLLPDESILIGSQAEAPRLQVYVQAGAGLLLYNPHSYIGRERATTSTEFLSPERNDYPALAGVLPVGGGISLRLTEQLRAGIEANYYFTTTSQLDDVFVRLNKPTATKDGFGTVMLKLNYALPH